MSKKYELVLRKNRTWKEDMSRLGVWTEDDYPSETVSTATYLTDYNPHYLMDYNSEESDPKKYNFIQRLAIKIFRI